MALVRVPERMKEFNRWVQVNKEAATLTFDRRAKGRSRSSKRNKRRRRSSRRKKHGSKD